MLPIHLDICFNAKKIINRNITYIFELFLDICENLSYEEALGDIFPQFMLIENFNKCKQTVLELNEMCKDEYERDYLMPLYEYTLFHMVCWWIEVTDENDFFFEEISKEDSISYGGVDLYHYLNNKEKYLDFLFDDWDFDDVPLLFEIYKEQPQLINEMMRINLDDYIDLMPRDIKNEYFRLKGRKEKQLVTSNDENYIIKSIYNILALEAMRPQFYGKCTEVDFSDTIRNALFFLFEEKGIIIDREDRAGFALKDAGELDFYLWKMEEGIYKHLAIGESKKWGKYEESIIQLIGYMDDKIDFGFTIILNQTADINSVRKKRKEILEKFSVDGNFCVTKDVIEVKNMSDVLISVHENPEHIGTYFKIYHFIFNVNKPERKIAAKIARQ